MSEAQTRTPPSAGRARRGLRTLIATPLVALLRWTFVLAAVVVWLVLVPVADLAVAAVRRLRRSAGPSVGLPVDRGLLDLGRSTGNRANEDEDALPARKVS